MTFVLFMTGCVFSVFDRFRVRAFALLQAGGMTCLDDEGMAEISKLMDYYLENARILKEVCMVS